MDSIYSVLPTTHGFVRGAQRSSIYDDVYYSFEGIPFAKPPLGDLRFKAPQPLEPWSDVLDCLQNTRKPVQKNLYNNKHEGEEDCLYLNVYVKALHTATPLPVMIYIYGGVFRNGAATRDLHSPDYFMAEDIVLITVNYRLGPLGFLALKDPALQVPGNAGLKDQQAALRWIKQNCHNFNGDPNNITIFGNSAGSAAVHYLMMCVHAEGLFHKAILQSGNIFNRWSYTPLCDYAQRLAKACGYTGDIADEGAVYAYLCQVDPHQLCDHEVLTTKDYYDDVTIAFGVVVEPYSSPDYVVPVNALEATRSSWSNNIPLMIGGTSGEGLLRLPRIKQNPKSIVRLGESPELVLPGDVRARKTLEECRSLGKELIKLHFGDKPLNYEQRESYMNLHAIKIFWLGNMKCVYDRHLYATAPTYFYRFDVDSPTFNLYRRRHCSADVRGAMHADELSYLFYSEDAWKLSKDSKEYHTIRRMVGMWTSFAKHGNPNCAEIAPVEWQPTTPTVPHHCLNIQLDKVEMLELPDLKSLSVWLQLYDEEVTES